jgi:hypothetical protein
VTTAAPVSTLARSPLVKGPATAAKPVVTLQDLCIECRVRPSSAIRKRLRRAGIVAKKGAGIMSGRAAQIWESNDPELARV